MRRSSAPPRRESGTTSSDPTTRSNTCPGSPAGTSRASRAPGLGARYRMLIGSARPRSGGLIEIVECSCAARHGVVVGDRGRPARALAPARGGAARTRVELRFPTAWPGAGITGWVSERVAAPSIRRNCGARCSSSSARSSTKQRTVERPTAAPSGRPRRPELSCFLPADRALQLLLGHRRAALDAELLRLVVELLAGAPLLAVRCPERWPPRGRTTCRGSSSGSEVLDSPERAFSLFTVRAAISSARLSERPARFSLSLMCSYWRARLVPFLTPRGGISTSSRIGSSGRYPARGQASSRFRTLPVALRGQRVEELDLARDLVAGEVLLDVAP